MVSQRHLEIGRKDGEAWIEDLGSTNGTTVNGARLVAGRRQSLESSSLVRCGECLLVFIEHGSHLLAAPKLRQVPFGMAGRFHVPAIVVELREAALSRRAPLVTGPSGAGKELVATALASMWEMEPPRRHNVAASARPEETARVLFGVAPKAYTGVAEQDGLLVTAAREGRPLFLDEVHNLSPEAQATLLTVIEDGKFTRQGAEARDIEVETRIVLASNEPSGLRSDLLARLWRIDLPTLADRVADVPALLRHLIEREAERYELDVEAVCTELTAESYQDVMLAALYDEDFAELNVRALVDLTDRILSRIASGAEAGEAIDTVIDERLPHIELPPQSNHGAGASTHYEEHRELISAVFLGCGKNVLKTVELLREAGLPWSVSRRHLTRYVEKWGLK